MQTPRLTRRATLITAAGALAAPALAPAARAGETTPPPPAIAPWRRLTLGAFTVTPLLAGTRPMEKPQETFGLNASEADFAALSAQAHIPADRSLNYFTPVLVDTGTETVLFDTGLDPAGIRDALAAAGRRPEEITTVVLTHMHPDHIGGVMDGATPTFAQADYATGAVEFDAWAARGNETFEAKVRPVLAKMRMLADGEELRSGISAILAPGHTPGHMAFRLESGGRSLILAADTANHYVWSLERPDWEVRFDADKAQAAATRRRLFGMVAVEGLPFLGYHMPFPGVGYLEPRGEGFRFLPASYQFDL